jgi:DNA polymerase I-like protein with 3'-5' exonuclease and polymerase domains
LALQVCKGGAVSTCKGNLQMMMLCAGCPEVVRWIRDFRGHAKLIEFLTDIEKRTRVARPYRSDLLSQSGRRLLRCCPQIMTTNTNTGRLSMDKPNLQTVPNPRECCGVGVNGAPAPVVHSNIRRIFRAPRGFVLLSADYRQIELRLMAHFAADERLVAKLNGDPIDIFRALAASLVHITPDEVTPEQRKKTKELFYGLSYGMGTAALAAKLECGENEAAEWKRRYLSAYPVVRRPHMHACPRAYRLSDHAGHTYASVACVLCCHTQAC